MCVIIHLPAGAKFDFEALQNAVYNNWHSYGLVTRIDGKLDIKKVVPKNGEVSAEEVRDALEKDEEFERILHLRHNTAGATTLKNCHPFELYYDDHRQVVFMHNGTFTEYKPKKFDKDGKLEDDPNGVSDSVTFAEENIAPMLIRSGGNIEDHYLQKVVRKFWSGGNRGILISSDQDPWLIGDDWKICNRYSFGTDIRISNDLYFDKLVRGPEFERRAEVARLIREQEASQKRDKKDKSRLTTNPIGRPFESGNTALSVPFDSGQRRFLPADGGAFSPVTGRTLAPLASFDFTQPSLSQLSQSPVEICNDWDVYDREHLISLGNLNAEEWAKMYEDKTTMVFVADYMSSDYAALYAEHKELEDKVARQEKVIEKLANQLKGAA